MSDSNIKKLHHIKLKSVNDSHSLYVKTSLQTNSDTALICIHGATEYHLVFEKFKNFIEESDTPFSLYMPDLRGHGLSSGHRSFVSDFSELISDLSVVVATAKEMHKKIFLWGHSLGALIALKYVMERGSDIQGIICSNPPLKLKSKLAEQIAQYTDVITQGVPQVRLPITTEPEIIYSDRDFAKTYAEDPLFGHYISLKLGREILKSAKEVVRESYFFEHPALFLLSGKDHLIDQEVNQIFIKSIPDTRIELKEYKLMRHGIHNDKRSEKVFKDIQSWIQGFK